ncbi:hypothetical protein EJF18_40599 [Clavispora lusitaniae]|uniref:Uncharacterized protein n=1 Tax=Clavispora lusitaniae TaxID=36911 RepID=A0ACD0WMD0_CLALS|nr:hypothetical protein EJF14_40599 [Clavispora lusitaniae]QFZ34219.1 hypothetical protein EJF16_40599 [Clavispora lusitaniae]QFZ39903.1 hypothetical protein EJF15_40599 [Clavispora lusitaniae]QFZ45585.1 hypothetical protein EJF18_40599 [Clavispora lusitaniae]QFZ51249.1 hypothetical protein EJF17_40599 [Clavispora lusitaniae]
MSSPVKPLSPQRSSVSNSRSHSPQKLTPSPTKATNPFQATPTRIPRLGFNMDRPGRKNSPSASSKPAFSIYEDTPEEHFKYHNASPLKDEICHDDKENVLQPKVMALKQSNYSFRRPLSNLSISQFPGYMSARGQLQLGPVQLKEMYQPKHYTNESRSVHKFNRLPSYITPPRNSLRKILYRSTEVEDDDVELRLIAKQNDYIRRKRSMSVGINKGKVHLVAKNKFKIMAN